MSFPYKHKTNTTPKVTQIIEITVICKALDVGVGGKLTGNRVGESGALVGVGSEVVGASVGARVARMTGGSVESAS
jgi:hypothetical protein